MATIFNFKITYINKKTYNNNNKIPLISNIKSINF